VLIGVAQLLAALSELTETRRGYDESMAHPYLTGTRHPRVLAHRGLVSSAGAASGIAENSHAAVRAAVEAGADYVESDCHLTSDGTVVLFHDSSLTRVLGDPRRVTEVRADELAELMEPLGGLITLESALREFPHTRFNIDVKAASAAESSGRIIAPHAARVLLTSFDDRVRIRALASAQHAIRALRARGEDPGVPTPATSPGRRTLIRVLLALLTRSPERVASAILGLDALQIPERQGPIRVLTPRLIRAAHEHGVEVHVWTVNEVARMTELVALGVDGIVTDQADAALAALTPGA